MRELIENKVALFSGHCVYKLLYFYTYEYIGYFIRPMTEIISLCYLTHCIQKA